MLSRRSLLGFIAASPFIVKASSLMPVRSLVAMPSRKLIISVDYMDDGLRLLGAARLKIEGEPVVYDAIDDWYYAS